MPDKSNTRLPQSVHGKSAKKVARYAAIEAGRILKERFGLPNAVSIKGKRNLVTEADILSEKKILEILGEEFPFHGILSEESGAIQSDCEYIWIVDPLDGTNNYYFGIPYFCVNIALAWRGDVILGITL